MRGPVIDMAADEGKQPPPRDSRPPHWSASTHQGFLALPGPGSSASRGDAADSSVAVELDANKRSCRVPNRVVTRSEPLA
jgi:hypothetical protein